MKRNRIQKSNRLLLRREFLALFENPKVYKSRTFQAFYKESPKKKPRVGITIKARSINSVWRFKLKRIVREWFRTRKEEIGPIDLNIVLLVPAKPSLEYSDNLKKDLSKWK